MFRACRKDRLDVDIIFLSAEQPATGHVSQDRRVGIRHCLDDARGLLFPAQIEPAMHTRNNEIERAKHRIRIIQRTVYTNVRFDPLEDPESLRQTFIQLVYLPLLESHAAFAQSARISRSLRVVANPEIMVSRP